MEVLMKYNPQLIAINNEQQARLELEKLKCDPSGINIMSGKAVFKTIKLENVPAKAANLLKQTFLAKGGEVAISRGTADLSIEFTDVIICATLKHYRLALAQLKAQPWGLPSLAAEVESILKFERESFERHYEWSGRKLDIRPHRTLVMGILNVTPDSFSDGGKYAMLDKALKHAEEMVNQGADIIDIGAESTRPYGASYVNAEEELNRLLPVLEKLLSVTSVPISIDTYKAQVAEAALNIGAHIINDIWGLQYDTNMASVVAKYDAPVIVMHNKNEAIYSRDIMSEMCDFLRSSIDIGIKAGINPDKIIVDPGVGFGKTTQDNLMVISRLDELKVLGCPILLATSRKRFIGEVLDLPVDDRVEGTSATTVTGILKGVNIVRVHDVQAAVRSARMTDAIQGGYYHE